MKYLMIQNKGLLEMAALTLLGASTKRDDPTMIGLYGSGNKYGISTLLRNNIPLRIFAGANEIFISTEKVQLKDKTFDHVIFTYKDIRYESGFTIQAGPQWEIWFAIREFYCNAIDEGGYMVVPNILNPEGSEDNTRFFIGITDEIRPILTNWNHYFSMDRVDEIEDMGTLKLYPPAGKGIRIYRRGILVMEDQDQDSVFDYDYHDACINESRVLESIYGTRNSIMVTLIENAPAHILTKILFRLHNVKRRHELFEAGFSLWCGYREELINNIENWKKALANKVLINSDVSGLFSEDCQRDDAWILPSDLTEWLAKNIDDINILGVHKGTGKTITHLPQQLDADEFIELENVKNFLNEAGYPITSEIEIVSFVAQGTSATVYGMVDNEKILLDKQAFSAGQGLLAMVLFEEQWYHINHRYQDQSRNGQNWLMSLLINEFAKRTGQI